MQSIIGKIIKIIATGCHILRLKCRKVDSLRLSVCLLGGVWHIVKEVGVLLGSRGVYCRPGEAAPAFGEVRCGAALCGVQSVSCPVVLITFLLSLCLSLCLRFRSTWLGFLVPSQVGRRARSPVVDSQLNAHRCFLAAARRRRRRRDPSTLGDPPVAGQGRAGPSRRPACLPALRSSPLLPRRAVYGVCRFRARTAPYTNVGARKTEFSESKIFILHMLAEKNNNK